MTARLHLALAACFACAAFVSLPLIAAVAAGLTGPMPPRLLSASALLSTGWILLDASGQHLAKARGEAGR